MKPIEILEAIKHDHVLKAIKYVDKHGLPKRRNSTKFSLEWNGRFYPPKYLIATAGKIATGHTLTTDDHSGGEAR